MDQPITLHWQSSRGTCTAILTSDLFGTWVLITTHANWTGRTGRAHQKTLPSYAKGMEALRRIRRKRRNEGYILCGSSFQALEGFNPHSIDTRTAESGAVLRVFAEWGLNLVDQGLLLGVSPSVIEDWQDGEALADEPPLLERVAHLLAIHKALRHLFPGDPGQMHHWVKIPNGRFNDARPLDLMLASLDGLLLVRRDLESEASSRLQRPLP